MEQTVRFCTTSDGVRIAYTAFGSGTPLVVTPGWISHLELDWPIMGPLLGPLARDFAVVRYDKRGTGLSDRRQPDLSIAARTLDLTAVTDAVGLRDFALFGMSEGGPIALTYAAEHPERVSHLVLYGTYAHGGFGRADRRAALAALVRAHWGLASKTFVSLFMPEASAEQNKAMAAVQREGASVDDAVALLDAIAGIDVRGALARIVAPVLVLHSKDDEAIPFECGRELAASLPTARFISTTGGHLPVDAENAARLAEAIRAFVHGDAAGAPSQSATRREAAARPHPPAFTTVMFTDVERNTELLQRLGDEVWRDLLREHERITRAVLKEHGGDEVKVMGDGFMVSFTSVTGALECAIALQVALAQRNASAQTPILVRIGVNAGEPIAEQGDLFGTAVSMAARVAGTAQGGEIVVSNVVRELVAGKGFLFADRGDVALRGFEDPVRLYELRWSE
ncbi:MAG: adenylate/guanylate cyclase domain-containing protein [Dehalococcoidia bacterium]